MKDFTFNVPQDIIFGKGSLKRLPELLEKSGSKKMLLISGPVLKKIGMVEKVEEIVKASGIEVEVFTDVEANPSVATVDKATEAYKKAGATSIVAFGGGSPMDVAKAVGVLAKYGGEIGDYEGALIHAWEAYTSRDASPFSDAMAEKAKELIGANLRRFVANRQDEEAAAAMLSGSMFAGIAFAWARLGNIHAMSHPVSAYFHVAHGVANAILLPTIVEYNALADHGRYEKIYNYISKEKDPVIDFVPEMLVDEARDLLRDLGIPQHLADVGVTEDKIELMAADAMKSGNIMANPRQSTIRDIIELYKKAM